MLPGMISIHFEVKDLVSVIEFYHTLLGVDQAELFPGHAIYTITNPATRVCFIENPATEKKINSCFSLQLHSDEAVYELFKRMTDKSFSRTVHIDPENFRPGKHNFTIADPNGIKWEISACEVKKKTIRLFNIPRMNSMWDILKPI